MAHQRYSTIHAAHNSKYVPHACLKWNWLLNKISSEASFQCFHIFIQQYSYCLYSYYLYSNIQIVYSYYVYTNIHSVYTAIFGSSKTYCFQSTAIFILNTSTTQLLFVYGGILKQLWIPETQQRYVNTIDNDRKHMSYPSIKALLRGSICCCLFCCHILALLLHNWYVVMQLICCHLIDMSSCNWYVVM